MFSSNASQVGGTDANYIEDVFSTYLYTGTGASRTIVNNIDLATYGGLIWIKDRIAVTNHCLVDTVQGITKNLVSNTTAAAATVASGNDITSFTTTGWTFGNNNLNINNNGDTFASWTFRKRPKFFDVVTYTGTMSVQNIAHNLGSVPGSIIVKRTDSTSNWFAYHRSVGNTGALRLNTTAVVDTSPYWNNTSPTSTQFTVGVDSGVNANGATYVAYLFAHDAGGFGLTGLDNVISCGSVSATGSTLAEVNLGYEPQWLLIKGSNIINNWSIIDNMRGFTANSGVSWLQPNTSAAEVASSTTPSVYLTSTGFKVNSNESPLNGTGTYIYIAIRRGPMKVPTTGTSVFSPNSVADDTGPITTNFPVDMFFDLKTTGVSNRNVFDRLRGNGTRLFSNLTDADDTITLPAQLQSNTSVSPGVFGGSSCVVWSFRRAPGFFDEVCYTGTGANLAVNHNLGVAPEMMIVKRRNYAGTSWYVSHIGKGTPWATFAGFLNDTAAFDQYYVWYQNPTSTQFFVEATGGASASGGTYVSYLFATCPGVSKVGSYTGNGSTQTINCGFTGGARFVLIKRTDAVGDWYVYDTARGMTTLTDPYLLLNSNNAQTATLGSVTTVSTGFAVNAAILAAINTNAASYIFLAIA